MIVALKKAFDSKAGLKLGFGSATGQDRDTYDPSIHGERRLNKRLHAYWHSLPREGAFPSLDDIQAEDLGDDWGSCFIVDCTKSCSFPNFSYLGPRLARYSGVFLSGKCNWTCTVLDKATEQIAEAVKVRKPLLVDDDLELYDGRRLLFRSVLLPMSQDGKALTHLFGGANGIVLDAKG